MGSKEKRYVRRITTKPNETIQRPTKDTPTEETPKKQATTALPEKKKMKQKTKPLRRTDIARSINQRHSTQRDIPVPIDEKKTTMEIQAIIRSYDMSGKRSDTIRWRCHGEKNKRRGNDDGRS